MKLAALIASLALAAPAFGQEASSGKIDWSKPVVGVDSNILNTPAKDAPRPVEVYTRDDLKVQKSPTVEEFVESLAKPAELCDPAKIGVTVQCTAPKDGAPPAPAAPPRN
jgi:hypothetical protein